jgi:hypothetical protein
MLGDPENKVWLDADTIVATSDRQAAIRRCRELAEYRTNLRSFKSPTLGRRMKHLDIKHRVFLSDCSLEASSLHHQN